MNTLYKTYKREASRGKIVANTRVSVRGRSALAEECVSVDGSFVTQGLGLESHLLGQPGSTSLQLPFDHLRNFSAPGF